MNPNKINDHFVQLAKEELDKLELRRKALLDFLATFGNSKPNSKEAQLTFPTEDFSLEEEGTTIRERILGVIKTLIDERNGKSARFNEIIGYIEKNNIDMGKSEKPRNLISSILSTEVNKPNGVLKKVRRGMYNFR